MPKRWTASKGMSMDLAPLVVANMTAFRLAMALKSWLHSSCRQAGCARLRKCPISIKLQVLHGVRVCSAVCTACHMCA